MKIDQDNPKFELLWMNHYHYCCYLVYIIVAVTHTICTFLGLFSSTVLL